MESLFASLKTEYVHRVRFRSRAEARAALFGSLEVFYNRQRLHSGLVYCTPAEARAEMSEVRMRVAALVDRAPGVVLLAADTDEHLI